MAAMGYEFYLLVLKVSLKKWLTFVRQKINILCFLISITLRLVTNYVTLYKVSSSEVHSF